MKPNFKIALIGIALVMGFTSCSNDDEPEIPQQSVIPSTKNVFSQGAPKSFNGAKITTNDKGQVTKIVSDDDEITFEYGTFSRADEYQVKMSISDPENAGYEQDFYFQLNDKGFAKKAIRIFLDEPDYVDTWEFGYNDADQLNYARRVEDDEVYRITYTDGNITKVLRTEQEYRYEYDIFYTDSKNSSVLPNKGNVMLFYRAFYIDLQETEIAYYAGLLGKSTNNLPVRLEEVDDEYPYEDIFNWTMTDGLPTTFWSTQDTDKIYFTWK